MKFSIKEFFSKCDQIHRFGHIYWKKSWIENFIFFVWRVLWRIKISLKTTTENAHLIDFQNFSEKNFKKSVIMFLIFPKTFSFLENCEILDKVRMKLKKKT